MSDLCFPFFNFYGGMCAKFCGFVLSAIGSFHCGAIDYFVRSILCEIATFVLLQTLRLGHNE